MGCSVSKSCTQIGRNPKAITASSTSSVDPALCSVSSPTVLSLPSHLVHHPPLKKGDTYHLVSLTSSTYGSLLLIDPKNPDFTSRIVSATDRRQKLSPMTYPAKKVKENPSETVSKDDPLSPDSVINAWELMDGLDDPDFDPSKLNKSGSPVKDAEAATKPSSFVPKDDPNALHYYEPSKKYVSLSNGSDDDRVILYFTSLRGIRKTFEDCRFVRMTLRGFQVPVDERDISMDSSYKKELQNLLKGKPLTLPQVFIRGNHVGGAEKIKQLNEAGELGKLLEGFPIQDHKLICVNCGDARFVPCLSCSGSRKVFDEKEGKLRRCSDCNENGLKRCPCCCCS
ncbi:uncharacterized protein At5g39865-like [Punica granatum]|uniref:Uncharacterized protein At5g39865-like n=2 Tax=Punica granatum TaxID=22663 RepID=A0A6P8D028_PUNGR|nr:uncharacterized protein At5g39865-like [Punica granatum]PKI42030.1 hypothetical protein CRG98_037483 [Punica granatum]